MASDITTDAGSIASTTASPTTTITTTTESTTVPTTTVNDDSTTATSAPPNVGMVIGITISATLFVFIALFVALFLRRKYLRKKKKPLPNPLPNPDDIDKIALENRSKKVKKGNKKEKHTYEKDPTSTLSVEPEAPSCPAFMAPDPPSSSSVDYENAPSKRKQKELKLKASESISSNGTSEPKYVNAKKKGQNNEDVDEYVAPKMSNTRLYSTGEGAEYYVCDNNKATAKSKKGWKAPPRNPLEDSITSTCSALDYVNMQSPWKYLELVPESKPVDEPQDLYEPMNS